MKTLLCLRQSFAVLGEIQKSRNLIWLQADDRLLVKLGHRDQGRNIPADLFGLIEILIHAANGGKLARFPTLIIGINLAVFGIVSGPVKKLLQIHLLNLIQYRDRKIRDLHFGKLAVVFMHVFEKDAKIVGIGEPCPCAGIL